MSLTELSARLDAVLDYLRESEQQQQVMQDDIDSLLARVADLEQKLSDIE